MAGKTIKGLTVEIGGDTTKLGKALEGVEKKTRSLSSELGQINKLLKFDPGNAELLAQKQQVLADAVANTREKLDTLKEAERQVQAQFERGEVSEEQVRALQREIIATTNKLEGYEKAAKETADAVEELGNAGGNSRTLTQTVEDQRQALARLKTAYADVVASQGKSSKEAKALEKELGSLSSELKENEQKLGEAEKAADEAAGELDDLADSAEKAGNESERMGSKLGGVVKGGLAALTGMLAGAAAALIGSAEATREYRQEMGKLDTAFTTAGHSSEAATETYKTLQGVLGETDQAVEAANHLAQLAENEQDLATWTNIATGVYATFGASLPIEGLTEAANETAKTGALTGSLADALNWAGVNEEKFQAQLDACTTEQERQALITETLNGLYSEAADKYRETNAEIIRANEANEAWTASMADIGAAIEPVLTDVKLLGASLLSDLVPGVEGVASAFRGILEGDAGAADALGEALSGLVSQLLRKLTDALPVVAEVATSLITELVTSFVDMAPQILSAATDVVLTLVEGLTQAGPELISSATDLVYFIIDALAMAAPDLLLAAVELFTVIVEALPGIVGDVVEQVVAIVDDIVYGLQGAMPQLILAAQQLFRSLVEAFKSVLPQLTALLPVIVEGVVSLITMLAESLPAILPEVLALLVETMTLLVGMLPTLIPLIVDTVLTLVTMLTEQLPLLIPQLVEAIVAITMLLVEQLPVIIPMLIEACITIVTAIIEALPTILVALTDALPEILLAVWETIVMVFENLPEWFGQLFEGAVEIIKTEFSAIGEFFSSIWGRIKEIYAPVGNFFKNAFTTAWNGIKNAFSAVGSFFSGVWSGIKNVFSSVGSWFKNIFSDAWENIKRVFSGVKSFFLGIWDTIKSAFSSIGVKIGDAISGAVKQAINGLLGKVEDIINGFFRLINGAINAINKIPGVSIKKISEVKFTRLAHGGVVDKPTPAIFGEDGAEAVVPLERNTEWIQKVASEFISQVRSRTGEGLFESDRAGARGAGVQNNDSLMGKLDRILEAIAAGQVLLLDGDALVGATADRMDNALGQRRALAARGAR